MKGKISRGFVPEIHSVLGIILIYSLLQASVTLAAAGASFVESNSGSYNDSTFVKNFANCILFFLTECRANPENPVIVAGNLAEIITTKIHRSETATLTLFTKPETSLDQSYARAKWTEDFYEKAFFRFQYQADIFLVAAKSQPILRHLIKQLTTSRWWNLSGLFLILNEELEESTCGNAYHYLSTAWLNGLLSALYLCRDNTDNLALYAFNPFENIAPKPEWKTVGSHSVGRNGHPWTLFRRDLNPKDLEVLNKVYKHPPPFLTKLNCGNILFDKTRSLNGYPVRVNAVHVPPFLIFPRVTKTNSFKLSELSGEDGWLAQTLWEWLNATIVEVPHTGNWEMGFTDEEDVDHGVYADVKNGKVDMSLNHRYLIMSKQIGTTYPHNENQQCFVTKSNDIFSVWKFVTNSIDPFVAFLALAHGTILVLIPLLRNIGNRKCLSMLLNVTRVLVSTSMVQSLPRFFVRFSFVGVLALVGITNSVLQIQISAMVIEPKKFKNIDTMEDLEKSGNKIYGSITLKDTFIRPELQRRFFTSLISAEECFKMAMDDASVACTADCLKLSAESMTESELHIAEEPIAGYYTHYVAGRNWPLLDRVNQLIARMVSAGLTIYFRRSTPTRYMIKENTTITNGSSSTKPRRIGAEDLEAVRYGLVGGLVFATLIFLCEIAYFRWKNK